MCAWIRDEGDVCLYQGSCALMGIAVQEKWKCSCHLILGFLDGTSRVDIRLHTGGGVVFLSVDIMSCMYPDTQPDVNIMTAP
jgi:hypothetical protein